MSYSLGELPPKGACRLHLNEYQYECHPDVIKATIDAVPDISTYTIKYTCVDPIASYCGLAPKNVLLTAGIDQGLKDIIMFAITRKIQHIVTTTPTYSQFIAFAKNMTNVMSLHEVQIGLNSNLTVRTNLLLFTLSKFRKSLVYLGNPGNPLGELWGLEMISRIARTFEECLFLIDEAYIEFDMKHSVAELCKTCNNVVVTRTFSKAFGLANLRVGYILGNDKTIDAIRPFVGSKSVNGMAVAAVNACLKNLPFYQETCRLINKHKEIFCKKLGDIGWYAQHDGGNFMLLYAGEAEALCKYLSERKIIIRNKSEFAGLNGFVRITIGNGDQNLTLLNILRKIKPMVPIQIHYTDKTIIYKLRRMMSVLLPLLKKSSLRWWFDCGSLLGVVRHKGIIPWDNDIDISYLSEGIDLNSIEQELNKKNMYMRRSRGNKYWQISTERYELSEEHIDLFPFECGSDNIWRNSDDRYRAADPEGMHCNTWGRIDEFVPFLKGKYYDETVNIPANWRKMLDRSLPGWETNASIKGCKESIKFVLKDYSPA